MKSKPDKRHPGDSDINHRRIVGEKLRSCREAKGLTLQELAEKVSKSAPTLYRIEKGLQSIDLITFLDILRKLDTSPLKLLAEVELASTPPGPERRVVEILHRLIEEISLSA